MYTMGREYALDSLNQVFHKLDCAQKFWFRPASHAHVSGQAISDQSLHEMHTHASYAFRSSITLLGQGGLEVGQWHLE
jgi:hypothetical protein